MPPLHGVHTGSKRYGSLSQSQKNFSASQSLDQAGAENDFFEQVRGNNTDKRQLC
jgi:hypothetical protein